VFDDPAQLDVERVNIKEHLGFGHGIHFCIGARVARMEAKVILEELLQRTSNFTLDADHEVQHVPSIFVRRMPQLHLRVSA
jgi:cytochrome P450